MVQTCILKKFLSATYIYKMTALDTFHFGSRQGKKQVNKERGESHSQKSSSFILIKTNQSAPPLIRPL